MRVNLVYYSAFVTFLSVVFFGFGMRAVSPNARTSGEHAIDIVWGSVIQLGGTYLLTQHYYHQAEFENVRVTSDVAVLAWLILLGMVLTFGVLYPILFLAIKV